MKQLVSIKFLPAALAAAVLLLGGGACSRTSEEEQVRAVIAEAEVAAEARSTSDVMKLVADDYRDDHGNSKQELTQLLRGYFLIHPKVELLIKVGPVEFETATRASVLVEIAMVGTQSTGDAKAALTGDLEALHVQLRKEDSQWLVVRADREEGR